MSIDETCSCGARFRVDIADLHTSSAAKAVVSWRETHHHDMPQAAQDAACGSNRRSVGQEDAEVLEGAENGGMVYPEFRCSGCHFCSGPLRDETGTSIPKDYVDELERRMTMRDEGEA